MEEIRLRETKYTSGATLVASILKIKDLKLYDHKTRKRLFVALISKVPEYLVGNISLYPRVYEGQSIASYFSKKRTVIELSYDELKRKGFVIISVPATNAFFDGQSVAYLLNRKEERIPAGARILDSKPRDVIIHFHTLNNAVKLYGKNCGEGAEGRWTLVSE